jgi:cation diffusion facilitator family transporter
MHTECVDDFRHRHAFLGHAHDRNEKRIRLAIALTAVMMVAEIVGGTVYGSMALLADGWHMSTHLLALGISALAYAYARRHALNPKFTFGTGKLGDLAGFASALILGVIAGLIGYESVVRLAAPVAISYQEALLVAGIGLAVNLACAWLLASKHDHGHDHGHSHDHPHAHTDHNMRSAVAHVLADAATSVLAILGLFAAWIYGWVWMDALMGIVGAAVIARWSIGLIRDTGAVLLDAVPDKKLSESIRKALETEGDRVADLHLWRVGPGHMAAIISIVSDHPAAPQLYKVRLGHISHLAHVTVEVQPCEHAQAVSGAA